MQIMKIGESKYKNEIAEYFDYTFNFEFLDIVAEIIERIDNLKNQDDILETIDNTVIYYNQEWTIYRFYQLSPRETKYEDVFESFINDILTLAEKIENKGTEKC